MKKEQTIKQSTSKSELSVKGASLIKSPRNQDSITSKVQVLLLKYHITTATHILYNPSRSLLAQSQDRPWQTKTNKSHWQSHL